ncbi:hypothetical protein IRJ41_012930 [Triplophysa rosa]|uniref:Uncharacterized protein n=1 Tax=Triplophysa rosa TaxID=992332 RepID=A0A9W7X1T8_TRIRA|nr:hypothetical protein IRJ41_012930 [Triplophysa rosa]
MSFCHNESDIEENVSKTDDNVEEDPDYEASSSDENESPSVEPPIVTQPPVDTLPSKNGNSSGIILLANTIIFSVTLWPQNVACRLTVMIGFGRDKQGKRLFCATSE